jgi:hypothetical protein
MKRMKYRYNYATMKFEKINRDSIELIGLKIAILILFVAFITQPLWGK